MGSPLRILHVVVNMNRGGAETFIMNLYRNIDRTKVQFDFLTCKEGVFDEEILKLGGKVHRIPYLSEVGHSKYVKELDRFFAANRNYRIIHSHMDKVSGLVIRSAKKAGIPYRISHSHNTSSEGSLPAKIYKWFVGKSILNQATHFLACSTEAASWLFKEKSQAAGIIKNGIESDKFAFSEKVRNQVRKELDLHNKFVVGHVGRFFPQKNHSFLIKVFEQINRINQNSVLVLVGDGPLKVEIEKQVKNLKLGDRVNFLGVRSDIYRLLQAFDVFVFPSMHEGLPVTLIEAQGTGLPCLISDTISKEVDLGANLISYESIKMTPEMWAKKIVNIKRNQKASKEVSLHLIDKGYDIKNTSAWFENYYSSLPIEDYKATGI